MGAAADPAAAAAEKWPNHPAGRDHPIWIGGDT